MIYFQFLFKLFSHRSNVTYNHVAKNSFNIALRIKSMDLFSTVLYSNAMSGVETGLSCQSYCSEQKYYSYNW